MKMSRSERQAVKELEAEHRRLEENRKRAPRAAFLTDVIQQALILVRARIGREGDRWARIEESNLWHLQQQIESGFHRGAEAHESVNEVVAKALLRARLIVDLQDGRAVVREKE